jgi:hypothetical protein
MAEHTRVVCGEVGVTIWVWVISRECQTPVTDWVAVRTLPSDSPAETINTQVRQALDDTDYFAVCAECQNRVPVGRMHDTDICQSCAERNHGVVY